MRIWRRYRAMSAAAQAIVAAAVVALVVAIAASAGGGRGERPAGGGARSVDAARLDRARLDRATRVDGTAQLDGVGRRALRRAGREPAGRECSRRHPGA